MKQSISKLLKFICNMDFVQNHKEFNILLGKL